MRTGLGKKEPHVSSGSETKASKNFARLTWILPYGKATAILITMPKKQPQEFKVDVEFEGKVYSGVYVVSSGTITVEAEYGSLTTQAGGPNVKFMARQLFREILEGAKSRGELKK
jgi:hypothetical protein